MNINFGFIYGINDVDTLYFANKDEQVKFFTTRIQPVRFSLNQAYYPPYYTNKIRVSTSDGFSPNNTPNYCVFQYDNDKKYYYYFVEDVTYISEELYELSIRMDTIQTFMFDIKVKDPLIERVTPVANELENKKFILENVSNGNFVLKTKYQLNSYNIKDGYVIVLKCNPDVVKFKFGKTDIQVQGTFYNIDNNVFFQPFVYCIVPINEQINMFGGNIFITTEDSNGDRIEEPITTSMANLLYDNNWKDGIVDTYILPITLISNYLVNDNLQNLTLKPPLAKCVITDNEGKNENVCIGILGNMHYEQSIPNKLYINCQFNIQSTVINYTPIFDLNNHTGEYLYSDNYIRMTIGDSSSKAVLTLNNFKGRYSIYYKLLYDLEGVTYYNIYPTAGQDNYEYNGFSTEGVFSNEFDSCASSSIINSGSLRSSDWKANLGNRQRALTRALVGGGIKLASSAIGAVTGPAGMIASSLANKAIDSIMSNDAYQDHRYKTPHLTKRGKIALADAQQQRSELKGRAAREGINAISDVTLGAVSTIVDTATSNLFVQTADTIRNDNNYFSNIISNNSIVNFEVYVVDDIDAVDLYYRRNGVLVNRIERGLFQGDTDSIFTHFHRHSLYDCLKINRASFACVVNNSTDVIDDIQLRLRAGIRMWTVPTDSKPFEFFIGDFTSSNTDL